MNSLVLAYLFRNTGSKNERFVFSPSVDLSFPGEGERYLRVLSLGEGDKEAVTIGDFSPLRNIKGLEFRDLENEAVLSLESSRSFNGRVFHVRSGFPGLEEYQSTCVMPLLPVSLEENKTWKVSFSLKINS